MMLRTGDDRAYDIYIVAEFQFQFGLKVYQEKMYPFVWSFLNKLKTVCLSKIPVKFDVIYIGPNHARLLFIKFFVCNWALIFFRYLLVCPSFFVLMTRLPFECEQINKRCSISCFYYTEFRRLLKKLLRIILLFTLFFNFKNTFHCSVSGRQLSIVAVATAGNGLIGLRDSMSSYNDRIKSCAAKMSLTSSNERSRAASVRREPATYFISRKWEILWTTVCRCVAGESFQADRAPRPPFPGPSTYRHPGACPGLLSTQPLYVTFGRSETGNRSTWNRVENVAGRICLIASFAGESLIRNATRGARRARSLPPPPLVASLRRQSLVLINFYSPQNGRST